MSTLGGMKAEIADDLARSDLTTQIASAISHAITLHKRHPFWWTRNRSTSFSTTAGKSIYTDSDNLGVSGALLLWGDESGPLTLTGEGPLLSDVIRLHNVFATRSTGKVELVFTPQPEMEALLSQSGNEGFPTRFGWYDGQLFLFPAPDSAYTITLLADMHEAAPATDGEINNRWMTDCYNLIRAEAKRYLARHVIRDRSLAEDMGQEVDREFQQLLIESGRKDGSGIISGADSYIDRGSPYQHGGWWRRW